MGVIVIDPGHGGTANKDGSSANNATSASGVLEKTLTLDMAKRIRWSLLHGTGKAHAAALGKPISVFLTRDSDVNVAGVERASVAADNDADLYLSLHCNGWNGTVRGTEAYIDRKYMRGVEASSAGSISVQEGPGVPSSGLKNINVAADAAFAHAIAVAARDALKAFDPAAKLRSATYSKANGGEAYQPPEGVKMRGLVTLSDAKLGTAGNQCRACLLEMEFIDHPAVDLLFNGAKAADVRNALAAKLAIALVDAL